MHLSCVQPIFCPFLFRIVPLPTPTIHLVWHWSLPYVVWCVVLNNIAHDHHIPPMCYLCTQDQCLCAFLVRSNFVLVLSIFFYIINMSRTTYSFSSSTYCLWNSSTATMDFIYMIYTHMFITFVFIFCSYNQSSFSLSKALFLCIYPTMFSNIIIMFHSMHFFSSSAFAILFIKLSTTPSSTLSLHFLWQLQHFDIHLLFPIRFFLNHSSTFCIFHVLSIHFVSIKVIYVYPLLLWLIWFSMISFLNPNYHYEKIISIATRLFNCNLVILDIFCCNLVTSYHFSLQRTSCNRHNFLIMYPSWNWQWPWLQTSLWFYCIPWL
jgi:hypothetical protein